MLKNIAKACIYAHVYYGLVFETETLHQLLGILAGEVKPILCNSPVTVKFIMVYLVRMVKNNVPCFQRDLPFIHKSGYAAINYIKKMKVGPIFKHGVKRNIGIGLTAAINNDRR